MILSAALYVLFFLMVDFVIYSLINNTGWPKSSLLKFFAASLPLVILLHCLPINTRYMLSQNVFFTMIYFSAIPIICYLFFQIFILRIIDNFRQQDVRNDWFVVFATKFSSFFFLKLTFLTVLAAQYHVIAQYLNFSNQ